VIQALIFDFDGLMLDTELAEYRSWQDEFQAFGCDFPRALWEECIGTSATFDPCELLAQRLGGPFDRAIVRERRRARFTTLMAEQTLMPGVMEYIEEAKRRKLKLGVASSSTRSWVAGYLEQFNLLPLFDTVKCSDDVGTVKPNPTVYREALRAMDVRPEQAVALEDSVNGMAAAQGAGIFCVVVPNEMTRQFSFDHADLRLNSLTEMALGEVLLRATRRVNGKG
jgi:HAD superfamily hydrolase (TIGR01509 family)